MLELIERKKRIERMLLLAVAIGSAGATLSGMLAAFAYTSQLAG
jgi:hypothetical protein